MKIEKQFILTLSEKEACALKKFLGCVPTEFLWNKGMTKEQTSITSNIWSELPDPEEQES